MAAAKKKKRSRYCTTITCADGSRKFIQAATKELFEQRKLEAKMQAGAGIKIADKTLLNDFADLWLKLYKAPPKTQQITYDGIKSVVNLHIKPFFDGMCVRDIKPAHIEAYTTWLAERKVGPTQQEKAVSYLRAIFNEAVENDLIAKSPIKSKVRTEPITKKKKKALTNKEANKLLQVASEYNRIGYMFCLIGLSTGLRRGEIIGLHWTDIDWKEGTINVSHNVPSDGKNVCKTMPKTKSGFRAVPMSIKLRYELEQELKSQENPVYVLSADGGKNMIPHNDFTQIWRHTLKLAGIETTPHLLRHTYCTTLFEAGMDIKQVQYLMGHAKPEITLEIYTHYREKQRAEETAKQAIKAVSYLGDGDKIIPVEFGQEEKTSRG